MTDSTLTLTFHKDQAKLIGDLVIVDTGMTPTEFIEALMEWWTDDQPGVAVVNKEGNE